MESEFRHNLCLYLVLMAVVIGRTSTEPLRFRFPGKAKAAIVVALRGLNSRNLSRLAFPKHAAGKMARVLLYLGGNHIFHFGNHH